jgi:hypothetical protein
MTNSSGKFTSHSIQRLCTWARCVQLLTDKAYICTLGMHGAEVSLVAG